MSVYTPPPAHSSSLEWKRVLVMTQPAAPPPRHSGTPAPRHATNTHTHVANPWRSLRNALIHALARDDFGKLGLRQRPNSLSRRSRTGKRTPRRTNCSELEL